MANLINLSIQNSGHIWANSEPICGHEADGTAGCVRAHLVNATGL